MAYFARAERAHQRNTNELLRPFGLKQPEWRILALAGELGKVSITELADKVVIERTTIGKMTARLAEKGWLQKHGSRSDGRSVTLTLTPACKKLLRQTSPMVLNLMAQYASSLSPHRYQNFFQALQAYERSVVSTALSATAPQHGQRRGRIDQCSE